MCELLLANFSHTARTEADEPHVWKRGMVITAQEDGHKWSAAEMGKAFKIIKCPKLPVADVAKYTDPVEEKWIEDDKEHTRIVRRRSFAINLDVWTVADDAYVEGATTTTGQLALIEAREIDLTTEREP
jgi:hypothetical protein